MKKRLGSVVLVCLALGAVVVSGDPEEGNGGGTEDFIDSLLRSREHLASLHALFSDPQVLETTSGMLAVVRLRSIHSIPLELTPGDGCDGEKYLHELVFAPQTAESSRCYLIEYESCSTASGPVARRISARFGSDPSPDSPPGATFHHPESLVVFVAALEDPTVRSSLDGYLESGEVRLLLTEGEAASEAGPLTYTLYAKRPEDEPDEYITAFDATHDPRDGSTVFGEPRPGSSS